jgi:RNA polymerase sigma-70 factor (ECF subfamily)
MTSAPGFDLVVAENLAMIRRIAAAHELNPSAREDLTQDILYAVWRALPKFRGEGTLRGFVARIATNRAITHIDRAVGGPSSVELKADLATADFNPEERAIASDRAARLATAIQALPIGLREPAVLALEGLTAREVAGVLGITPNAVTIRMTRARAELRKLIGE